MLTSRYYTIKQNWENNADEKVVIGTLFVSDDGFANATDSAQSASRFQEGTHYQVVKGFPFARPTVTELFSIYCGGCYQWEKGY